MDYDEEDNGAYGSIPEFGAIFMSNIETKKECLERKIFALPSSKAEFVKHIKAGMVLFLFEFKKRQLFGVYRATSDGGMNIVPHAFNYPGKHFPAQVCFTLIWRCDPLSEMEFRDAIRENYFSAKKFNFGLSEDQVRRLLYLFSSRKLKHKMPPRSPSEAFVGVAGMDRRLVGDDRLELSERRYMEPDEYEGCKPAAFCDHRLNSSARAKKDIILVDDGVNTEGDVLQYSEEDFLAKRRRIGNDDGLITNSVAENGIYNHGTLETFCINSPKDSSHEVRRLANGRRLLPAERVKEYQLDKILSHSLVDPLDVRANDGYRFIQRSRLFDEYNMHNGSGQANASDCYEKSLDKMNHAIDDDMFFIDDSVQRDTVKPVAYGDNNLNLLREPGELIDDHECLMNRTLENRYHLDCDGSPISAFDHSASALHKIRKNTAGGRLPINESEPDFGACSVEGFFSEKISRPLQCGRKFIHDQKYPVTEGRLNENMHGNISSSASLARNARYFLGVDRQEYDDERFRKSERADNEEDSCRHTDPAILMEYPSFSKLKQKFSSFPDKLLPEKGFPNNLDFSRFTFDDATITRVVPYSPEHPNLSHGYPASHETNQHSSLVRENHPHHVSPGNFTLSKNRLPQYLLESEKSSRLLDIAPEFGNKGFPNSSLRHHGSLLHEPTSSSAHTDLNASAPVNYRGSLISKLSPSYNDLENIGEPRSFVYPPKSRGEHFAFDGDLPIESQHVNKHVPRHEMDMLPGKGFSYPEAKKIGGGIHHPKRELASHENWDFRFSSNMNLKELHKISEAPPHAKSNVNRRSVFTRLTCKEESKFGEEKNDINFDLHDCYMDATADEIMEMLQQADNLSPRKLRKSGVGGQLTYGENAVNEKKTQCHTETNHSTVEKNKLNDVSLSTEDGTDEVPKETRMVDFKRRSDGKKILVGITADSDAHNNITGANEEVNSSIKSTLKRKKLVRPIFCKTGPATDAICSNQTLQSTPILDKDDKRSCETAVISTCGAEMLNGNVSLSNVLASLTHQPVDDNSNEHLNPEVQNNVVAHVLPSTSLEPKGQVTTNADLPIGSSQVLKETTQQESFGSQTSAECILTNADLQIGSSQVLKETTHQESFGIQTSAECILTKVDPIITGLNQSESPLEGFKNSAGTEEKRPKTVKSRKKIIKVKKVIKTRRKADMQTSQ